jgi:hypothetical protein
VGLDRGRRCSAADRFSDHRRLEQQQQYGKQRFIADGDQQRTYEQHAEYDRFGLDLSEADGARSADGSGPGPVAGRRQIANKLHQ